MFVALDVGLYITKSESGARRLRVEPRARDFASPDPLGVVILGTGSGEHGGFTYLDTASMELDPRRPRIATSQPSSRRSSPTARGAQ